MNRIDLHTHSTISDGTLTPTELIKYAKQKGLSAIALTDHDSVSGLEEAISEGKIQNIEVIPGIELSSIYKDLELHIVGLFIDYKNNELLNFCKMLRNERAKRNEKIINRLNEVGFDITIDEVKERASGESVTKGHIIEVMIEKDFVKDGREARDKYLYEGGVAHFKKTVYSTKDIVKVIKSAGGIPILAHPGEIRESKKFIRDLIIDCKNDGIEGIETYYYCYDDQMTSFFKKIADENDLLKSGGSDYHGSISHETDLGVGKGNLNIPYEVLEKIKERL